MARCEPGTTRRPVLCRQTAKRTGRQTAKRTGRQTLAANAPCFEDVERINNVERRRTRDVHETRHGVVSAKGGLCVALAMAVPDRTGACNPAICSHLHFNEALLRDAGHRAAGRRAPTCITLAASRMQTPPWAALVATLFFTAFCTLHLVLCTPRGRILPTLALSSRGLARQQTQRTVRLLHRLPRRCPPRSHMHHISRTTVCRLLPQARADHRAWSSCLASRVSSKTMQPGSLIVCGRLLNPDLRNSQLTQHR